MLRHPPVIAVLTEYDIKHFTTPDAEIKFLCPFHQHTGNSRHNASINRYTGKWFCYSCEATGNIVTFVSRWNGISKAAARRVLKSKFDWDAELAIFQDEEDEEFTGIEYVSLPRAYRPIRYNDPYIAENGYDFSVLQQLEVGYDLSKENGRFLHKGKLILPYFFDGKPVGWIYKIINGKYVFIKGFKKRRFLYAYDYARMVPNVVLVEGQRDCWRLRSFGINACALGGSYLSDEQTNMLLNNWSKIDLCFDGDKAGRKVTRKVIDEIAGMVNMVRVITMPEGTDPNDLKTIDEYNQLPITEAKYWRM